MARYTETLAIDKPFTDAWRGVHAALVANHWRIANVRDNTFFVRERISFETMLWRNPCRFAIHVAPISETRCVLHLIGSTMGFGPLPKNRIRKVAESLRGQVLGTIARIEPTPPIADRPE